MSLVERAKAILLTPKTEWPAIAAEPATIGDLYRHYAVILALLPVIGTVLVALIARDGLGIDYFVTTAILGYGVGLVLLYVMGLVTEALAPGFDGRKDRIAAFKLVIYACTPIWIAGLFAFLGPLAVIVSLAAFAYTAYLIYLGATPVLGVPPAKAVAFTAVLIVAWLVLSFLISAIIIGSVAGLFLRPAIGL